MKKKAKTYPYVAHCRFCGDGLLRFMRCDQCQAVAAVCDECELIWQDVAQVSRDPDCRASSSFPECPACHVKQASWKKLELNEIKRADLESYIGGRSE